MTTQRSLLRLGLIATGLAAFCFAASQPWKENASHWNSQDTERILNDSPWAQFAPAIFALAAEGPPPGPAINVPEGTLPNPHNGATDGRWDGGVSRVKHNGPPTLNVLVRWDSALPVRLARQKEDAAPSFSEKLVDTHYILTVIGLVPGGRYNPPQLNLRSGADPDPRNPEPMLENVMRYSQLSIPGKSSLVPDDAKLDIDTGALHLFFKRSVTVSKDDKDVLFETRFGSLTISKKFRLKDMLYQGRLQL